MRHCHEFFYSYQFIMSDNIFQQSTNYWSVFTCITIPILFSFFNKCISIMIRKNMGCPLKYSDLSRNAVNMVHFRLHDGWFVLQIRCHVVLWLHWWHFFDICLILWTWWSNDLQSKWMSKVICVLWRQRFKYILIRKKNFNPLSWF